MSTEESRTQALDSTYSVSLEPFIDSSAGDVGPVDSSGYAEMTTPENAGDDLLDEEDRQSEGTLPGGID